MADEKTAGGAEDRLLSRDDYHEMFDPDAYTAMMYTSLGDANVVEQAVKFMVDFFHDVFSSGQYTGTRLVDVCSGPSIHAVISASKYYKEVYLTEYTRNNRKFLKKWAAREKGAFNWTPVFEYVANKEGSRAADIEDRVRRSIRDILPCDLLKEEPFGERQSQLECVDAIVSSLTIEAVAPDHDSYKNIVKKFAQCLSSNGLLLLIGVLNQTYYSAGGDLKFYTLKVSLDFIQTSLEEAGFTDVEVKMFMLDDIDPDLADSNGMFALSAKKV